MEQRLRSSNRTVWDLLVLLGVALGALLVGAAAGFWFSEQRSENAAEVQEYFQQMRHLLLEEDLRTSAADSEAQRLARAQTLAIVANSDAENNRSVTRFLTDMDLVKGTDFVRLLSQAHLAHADLGGAFLPAADLSTSLLRDADLRGAMLVSANLGGAVLRDADLGGANLAYANLQDAVLVDADLSGANMSRAVLAGADLSGANLTSARVTDEQLDASESLEGTTMPDGSKHD